MEEKLEKLLNELANAAKEPVSPDLAEEIKRRIPHRLTPHRAGRDAVNIIIDFRINKLTAAAVIIITMVLLATLLGGRDSAGDDIYHDSTMLIKYLLVGEDTGKSDALAGISRLYKRLLRQGTDAVYYGECRQ